MPYFKAPNGQRITGSAETCPCSASIRDIDMRTGLPIYDSTGSTMFWDDQHQLTRDGKRLYLDDDGNKWPFDVLVRHEDNEMQEEEEGESPSCDAGPRG